MRSGFPFVLLFFCAEIFAQRGFNDSLHKAWMLRDMKEPEKAMTVYRNMLKRYPQDSTRTCYAIAQTHLEIGDNSAARRLYSRLITLKPQTNYEREHESQCKHALAEQLVVLYGDAGLADSALYFLGLADSVYSPELPCGNALLPYLENQREQRHYLEKLKKDTAFALSLQLAEAFEHQPQELEQNLRAHPRRRQLKMLLDEAINNSEYSDARESPLDEVHSIFFLGRRIELTVVTRRAGSSQEEARRILRGSAFYSLVARIASE